MLLSCLRELLNFGNMRQIEALQGNELCHAIFQAVDRIWSPSMPQKVLEIGCGVIQFLLWLDKAGHYAHGVYLLDGLGPVTCYKLPGNISMRQADPDRLPFESKSFDTVFFVLSLEHLSRPERALEEAFRVAKSSVIIVSFNTYSPYLWLVRLSGLVTKNPVSSCKILTHGMLVNMGRSAAGLPLHITSEPVRWRDLGTALLSPVIVTRFDFARQIMPKLEIPLTRAPSRQFVPSPSSMNNVTF